MSDPFQIPPGTNELINQNLVNASEIARRIGVSRAAVSIWRDRHPTFAAIAIPLSGRGHVFWWPQVEAVLADLGLPNQTAVAAQQKRHQKGSQPTINLTQEPA